MFWHQRFTPLGIPQFAISRDATRSLFWEGNKPLDRRKVSSWLKQKFIDDRTGRKGLFCKPKLTFWCYPRFGLKAVERENTGFLPKTNVSPAEK